MLTSNLERIVRPNVFKSIVIQRDKLFIISKHSRQLVQAGPKKISQAWIIWKSCQERRLPNENVAAQLRFIKLHLNKPKDF